MSKMALSHQLRLAPSTQPDRSLHHKQLTNLYNAIPINIGGFAQKHNNLIDVLPKMLSLFIVTFCHSTFLCN